MGSVVRRPRTRGQKGRGDFLDFAEKEKLQVEKNVLAASFFKVVIGGD